MTDLPNDFEETTDFTISQILRGFHTHGQGQILMTLLALMYEIYLVLITNQIFFNLLMCLIFFRLCCEQTTALCYVNIAGAMWRIIGHEFMYQRSLKSYS